jgi:PAS domain-containing protein
VSPPRTWAYDFNEIRFPLEAEGFGHAALSELFENVPLAIAVTLGPDHRYAFANKLFRSGLSISGDLIGKTLREALGERYTEQTQALRQHVLETGESCEIAGLPCGPTSHLGETFWDLKLLPVRDANNQVHGILTLGVDVTERVKARCEADRQAREAAINNERLALAVEATELGFWDWNAATDRTYWSPRQREIFGIPEEEPLTHDLWVSAIHP